MLTCLTTFIFPEWTSFISVGVIHLIIGININIYRFFV